MRLILTLFTFFGFTITAFAAWVSFSAYAPSGGGGGNVVFTPTQLYYMAASGSSDSYDGKEATHTTGTTGPWASPNHAVNCGDAIVAAPGTYNGNFSAWGTVSNCPSSTGGLAASPGGVYFAILVCGGSDLSPSNGCYINCATGTCSGNPGAGMSIPANYWAVEGWTINGNGSALRQRHNGLWLFSLRLPHRQRQ